ncbi:MAG: ferrous iron transport protein A [Coriobacteriia bacterium]|nr:ferrous iron transport protein A [Coriobacteriia bacterium]
MTLADVAIGTTVSVTDIVADEVLKQRLLDMGITDGAKITVRRFAPLGDPVEIVVRGCALVIRKEDATHIKVKQ